MSLFTTCAKKNTEWWWLLYDWYIFLVYFFLLVIECNDIGHPVEEADLTGQKKLLVKEKFFGECSRARGYRPNFRRLFRH